MDSLIIEKLRRDTPGCNQVLHLNNAGASLPPIQVLNAVKAHLDLEANKGGYEAADYNFTKSEQLYHNAARLLNCHPEEIAFVENATRAWDMAFYSFKFQKGDKIITALCEYASNYLAFLHRMKQVGIEIVVVGNDETGQLDLDDLEKKLDEKVKLIALTHVPTQGGLINPIIAAGKIAKKHGIPYLVDTTQSVGQMPIDVQEIGCDFLCATGRKYLRGPRGTGFLYARKSIINQYNPPFVDLHAAQWVSDHDYQLRGDARRFETWEQNIAGKIGLSVAIDYALELGIDSTWQRIQALAERLRQQLHSIKGITLHDLGKNKCGIVTFTYKDREPSFIQEQLRKNNINVSISLQDYARLDLAKRHLPSLVRASVHYYNSEEEIGRFCKALESLNATVQD
ncbi:aminotransferase class V-fold PLP-dependent enzyme [Legionella micdadei]|uniref:Aminotransferase class V n=1 Tax=Legionella micdadei TaxID=451 RepID=A0A098GGP5_LEGMI|nr:aminotransferase class V-fold PLP-dependent enzyme [Legionella micdadei]ARG97751.1 aminotransferase class V [Legionella micdadei]KTD28454.1 selenocysteine lyase, PLP-dependent [Legionella micdadei]NSL18774.1 aminotransferase class V-fold PLP-dependent enzyme [Legionella micdadei]CEG60656.1 Aminotransferase class V [Legionella micdadei]SCX84671.1 Selenocysteine lyase/Cysteine desulfurase [Legionella micdadei]